MGRSEISKGSFAIVDAIADRYDFLTTGAAIGKGVGPILVGKIFPGARVALPGINTTAHQLFQFWHAATEQPKVTIAQMPFFEILPALRSGEIDAAVLIHEGRFIYEKEGLSLIEDLGKFWENQTDAMIPLGCIYAARDISAQAKVEFWRDLQESLTVSLTAYRDKSPHYLQKILPYMQTMAQEKSREVVEAHVDTYVTSDTMNLTAAALDSIATFKHKIATLPQNKPSYGVTHG